jgi:hypothetical protein
VRQDAPADQCRRRIGLADRRQDALDPVACWDRVVVDVGDVVTACFPCAGVAGHTDAWLLDTQQPRIAEFVDQPRDLGRNVAGRGAVDHEDVEPFVANRLPPQSVQVMRTDADGDIHAAQSTRRPLRKD